MLEIYPDIFAIESALFIKPLDMLVIGDLQLGKEEELRRQGHLVLDEELTKMKRRLLRLIKQTGASRLLINGDIKHEFARINQQEWDHVLDLFDSFKDLIDIIFVKGNHDTMLFPILEKRNIASVDHYAEDGFFFCHGHEVPDTEDLAEANTVIIGHEHPAVRFDDGVRKETAKCFLVGKWKYNEREGNKREGCKDLIVLPSFSEMSIGSDILRSDFLGPFLDRERIKKFAAYVVVEKNILRFGTVHDIMTAMKENE